ncbi:MAG: hypothetical protein mread185_000278 [Mycoplasmataceae bacterium]|nr:MAG: hypothetical protein mread185_000278 [Mycoplasmataceae bacterium]
MLILEVVLLTPILKIWSWLLLYLRIVLTLESYKQIREKLKIKLGEIILKDLDNWKLICIGEYLSGF